MSYIFLDIDGVLNKESDWRKMFTVNADCINEFCDFYNSVGGRVILISTWKNGYYGKNNPSNADYIKILEKRVSIYGKIEDGDRLEQIKKYVKEHDIVNYVIIDDDKTEYSQVDSHICFIDAKKGFTSRDSVKCRKILAGYI